MPRHPLEIPNAPHDLGTYPFAYGRDNGGEAMPVEESGNMLILCDAIAHADGNADFVAPWWPQLTQWRSILKNTASIQKTSFAPMISWPSRAQRQSLVKAILGLATYGDLCRMRGDNETAKKYFDLAKADAEHWMKVADDGDHYRLAFDKPAHGV